MNTGVNLPTSLPSKQEAPQVVERLILDPETDRQVIEQGFQNQEIQDVLGGGSFAPDIVPGEVKNYANSNHDDKIISIECENYDFDNQGIQFEYQDDEESLQFIEDKSNFVTNYQNDNNGIHNDRVEVMNFSLKKSLNDLQMIPTPSPTPSLGQSQHQENMNLNCETELRINQNNYAPNVPRETNQMMSQHENRMRHFIFKKQSNQIIEKQESVIQVPLAQEQ